MKRCLSFYENLVTENNIEPGHGLTHVKKVERAASAALAELREMSDDDALMKWATAHGGDETMLEMPSDVEFRITVAALLHEVCDRKLVPANASPKEQMNCALNYVMGDFSDEFADDIYNMVDYCSAGKWGDRVDSDMRLYQLLVRWADRMEATGWIGIARTLLFAHSIRKKGYKLCHADAEFPTTSEELDEVAPKSRWEAYANGKPSKSAWGHLMDKIRHINGDDIPVPVLRKRIDDAQKIVDQFILDFTTKNDKRFDLELVIENLDAEEYGEEIKALCLMAAEADPKWIK